MDPQTKDNLRRAAQLAVSEAPNDHERLFGVLNNTQYLGSLQPLEEYHTELHRRLLVGRVIKYLMTSPHEIARQTLARLAYSDPWLGYESLQELLVIALVAVRPLPPHAVTYLDERSTPEAGPLHLVMTTLAANGSEPALRLFERKIADESHDEGDRATWLQVEYLVRRNDVAILNSCRRMIVEGAGPSTMQVVALESLCAYDPEWYLACTKPEAPPRLLASPEAKDILRGIISHAQQNMELEETLQLAVEAVAVEIGDEEAPA